MPDVPLLITPDAEHPELANVSVDGSVAGRRHRFVLDTGAARSQPVADDLLACYDTVGRHATSGVFGRAEHDVVRVPDLTVGALRHGPLGVVRVAPGAEVRDLLGMDVLGRHRLRFDFAGRRLEPDPPTPGSTLPLHLDDRGHPYVEVVLDVRVTAQAVWDTGAEVTVVDARFAESHRDLFHVDRPSRGTDATGAQRDDADLDDGRLRLPVAEQGGRRRPVCSERDARPTDGPDRGLATAVPDAMVVRLPRPTMGGRRLRGRPGRCAPRGRGYDLAMSEQSSENEPHDQDSEPGSKPTGAAVAETEPEGDDPDSGPASVPQDV